MKNSRLLIGFILLFGGVQNSITATSIPADIKAQYTSMRNFCHSNGTPNAYMPQCVAYHLYPANWASMVNHAKVLLKKLNLIYDEYKGEEEHKSNLQHTFEGHEASDTNIGHIFGKNKKKGDHRPL